MADVLELAAELRDGAGKGSARAARRAGRIPAVIYGGKKDPVIITISENELLRQMNRGAFLTSVIDLNINDDKERVLPRDMQLHPVSDMPLHVDFLRLSKDSRVTIEVPVHFVDEEECQGLKRGGVLNIVRHTIEVTAPGDAIPPSFTVSLADMDIGDSVHISAVAMPEGVDLTISDRDFTIATLVAPSSLKSAESEEDDEEGEEGEEGEEEEATEEGEEK